MQLGGFRKMLVFKRAESPADICGTVAALGWIVPGYFPPASPFTVFSLGVEITKPLHCTRSFSARRHTRGWPLRMCQCHWRCRSDADLRKLEGPSEYLVGDLIVDGRTRVGHWAFGRAGTFQWTSSLSRPENLQLSGSFVSLFWAQDQRKTVWCFSWAGQPDVPIPSVPLPVHRHGTNQSHRFEVFSTAWPGHRFPQVCTPPPHQNSPLVRQTARCRSY